MEASKGREKSAEKRKFFLGSQGGGTPEQEGLEDAGLLTAETWVQAQGVAQAQGGGLSGHLEHAQLQFTDAHGARGMGNNSGNTLLTTSPACKPWVVTRTESGGPQKKIQQ